MPKATSKDNKDLYQILGLKETASATEIKKAYRELARKNHPDRTGGDKAKESKFKDISAAYEVLSDPKRKAQYDNMRRGGFASGEDGQEVDYSIFEGIDGIEELFAQMRGGGRAGRAQSGGPRIVFEQSYGGGGGGGIFGAGSPFGNFQQAPPQRRHAPPQPRPAAPEPEQRVRTRDGHELLRQGDDLLHELELAVDEAVLGTRVDVPTLDGRVTLKVPPGTSSGTKLRLRGRGLPHADGSRGDQYVTVKIVVPTKLDAKAEELIKEFARTAPVKVRQ